MNVEQFPPESRGRNLRDARGDSTPAFRSDGSESALRVGSLFSGIGGIDLGLERAGMRVVWQCEANEYRRSVLRRNWPDVPCYEDVRRLRLEEWFPERDRASNARANGTAHARADASRVDLLCGGFPCQDLSVAGRRAGLQGERSSLFFEFARVAESLRPRWLLIENVPGLLSSQRGRDFAVVLASLAELGYGVCWRVLDSRFFGVPQRRRRVFIVGHLGATSAEPFLPFLEGGEGDLAESGEARPDVAGALTGRSPSRFDDQGTSQLIGTVRSHMRPGSNSSDVIVGPLGGGNDGIGRRTEDDPNLVVAAPLSHGSNPKSNAAGRRREDDENLVTAFAWQQGDDSKFTGTGRGRSWVVRAGDYTGALSETRHDAVATQKAVRRLTPVECCRLQGFPDDWLGEPNEKPDSPRYAALGDAVTVNVAEWIGRRILEAEAMRKAA